MLAKLKSETVAGETPGVLETGEPSAGRAEETLKYYVWIEIYNAHRMTT